MIATDLLPLARPIGEIHEDPANARLHPERNIESLMASLSQFGQRKPIVVQEEGMICRAGNGLLSAAKRLGWEEIAAVVVEEGDVSATAFAIADNRSAELSDWDFEVLTSTMISLRSEGAELGDLGWTDYELEPLLNADFNPPPHDPTLGKGEGGHRHSLSFDPDQWATVEAIVRAHRESSDDDESTDAEIVVAVLRFHDGARR